MKTSILIEDGIQQVVLTPENDFEKNIIQSLSNQESRITFMEGSFRRNKLGYLRHFDNSTYSLDEHSLIIVKEEEEDD